MIPIAISPTPIDNSAKKFLSERDEAMVNLLHKLFAGEISKKDKAARRDQCHQFRRGDGGRAARVTRCGR